MTTTPYNDIRDVLVNLPHGDPHGCMSYVRDDLFTVRHALIAALDPAPTSVFEFGALVGYFLVTALDAAPSIVSVGWVDNEQHTPGSNAQCRANVEHARPGVALAYARSSDIWQESFPLLPFDLVAVDSDHSYEGCLADLRAAHALGPRTIMVDDWIAGSHGDDIQAAVQTFRDETGRIYGCDEYVTVNGLAVLTRKERA